jgi:hypothetical protein
MNRQETDRLIDKYLEGATSPEEELLLAGEVSRPDAPAEWRVIATMLGTLTLDEAEYDEEMARRRNRSMWTRRIGWAIAASIVVVAGVGLWFNSQQESSTDIAIAYVDGQTITDEDRVLAMAEDAVCDIFSNSDAESSLYEIFNPEE